jgi:hypothetical protein
MACTKTLQGVIRITEVGDYYLALPDNGARAQNGLAINNVEEVYIVIETIVTPEYIVNLFLPKISDFNGGWNTKIYILNKNAVGEIGLGSVNLYSYVSETYTDYLINNITAINLSTNSLVHIFDTNVWGVLLGGHGG